ATIVAAARASPSPTTSISAPTKYGSFTPPRNSARSVRPSTAVTTNAGWSRCAVTSMSGARPSWSRRVTR
ncbi:MAG: hypothetical protein ACK559_07935, partial [bacterium]